MSTESMTVMPPVTPTFAAATADPPATAAPARASLASRVAVLIYGVVCYAIFFASFLYAMGFVIGVVTPTRLDVVAPTGTALAWLVNLGLMTVFAVQHSVMARPTFKRWWTRFVPVQIERSTYVLLTCVALGLLFWLWQPMGGVIWDVPSAAARATIIAVGLGGWLLILVSTFLINHFDLFGLRQVWLYLREKPYAYLRFGTPGPYRLIRHPLYLGWLIAFWAAPTMTVAHLVFSVVITVYILMAIQLEERNLATYHPDEYRSYRQRVPMLVPFLRVRPVSE